MQNTEMDLNDLLEAQDSDYGMGRTLVQIVVILLVLLMLANLPVSNQGFGLAQFAPNSAPVVVHDGLLLKGLGPEVYLVEGYKLRWITSPKASLSNSHLNRIQYVENDFLEQFAQGPPVRYLIRCRDNPNIYALESEQDRIRVIDASLVANSDSRWDRVHWVSCNYLDSHEQGPPVEAD